MKTIWMCMALVLTACSGNDDSDSDPGLSDTSDTSVDMTPRVRLETPLGVIVLELDRENAPVTVDNFMQYVDDGFYDGDDGLSNTIFHRVIEGFMIQGGGLAPNGFQRTTREPIVLESQNGLRNDRGSVAMARTDVPDSATSQFFINHVDNSFLNATGPGTGYAVFGRVVEGLDVVDAIAVTPTGAGDRPTTDVVITDCERVE